MSTLRSWIQKYPGLNNKDINTLQKSLYNTAFQALDKNEILSNFQPINSTIDFDKKNEYYKDQISYLSKNKLIKKYDKI
jgi:hypothetical protein